MKTRKKPRVFTAIELDRMLLGALRVLGDRHREQNSAVLDLIKPYLTEVQQASIAERWELIVEEKGWSDWRRNRAPVADDLVDSHDDEGAGEEWRNADQ